MKIAVRAGRYWLESGDNAINALIFSDSQNTYSETGFDLLGALNNPRLPILDLINSRSLTIEMAAKQRGEQAQVIGATAFRQEWFINSPEQEVNTVYSFLLRQVGHK